MTSPDTSDKPILMRTPEVGDGKAMWQLVIDSGVLDENSPYLYLLISSHFAKTSLVAEIDGEMAGFVASYIPPEKPDTIFVWQIGVSSKFRGRGLATKLLRELFALPACRSVDHLDATVTPSNVPSRTLFQRFAEKCGAECVVSPCFKAEDFPGSSHEREDLFRIGPVKITPQRSS